ncbi:chlorophyllase-1 [Jatropha curcas]|uniref:chlorophyllase-1 n=1 Tax=Jatropha curcas TaxID=180498 RepID=UPI0009D6A3BF|nr:chlorophyllase-1 [Jatropha curcas]
MSLIERDDPPPCFVGILYDNDILFNSQLYSCLINRVIPMLPISGPRELEFAAEVMNWLPSASGLQSVLPENIKADLNKLSVGGHSRGGKTAFALALGYANIPLKLKILALAALDPVEGMSKNNPTLPKTFTYLPQSLDLSIPVTVIGTGLGNQPICWLVCPACAPNEVNHEEFFNECRAPTTHFVAAEYGHMDMLNENIKDLVGRLTNSLCKSSQSPKEPMRKTVGGIVVAFLKAYFEGQSGDYLTIVQEPSVAPVKLDPVQFTEA